MTHTSTTNRITKVFADLQSTNKKGLMPFIVGGHPASPPLGKLLRAIDNAGVDIFEIGFFFF